VSTMDATRADLFAAATGSGTPLESERRVATGESCGLVGVGGLVPYYSHGGITIYHGDCRVIMPRLQSFDLLLTDPPYGIGADKAMHKASGNVVGHGHRRVAKRTYEASDWDAETVDEWAMMLARSLCEKQVIFGGNYYALPPTKCVLVWDKENDGNKFADCEIAWTNLNGSVRMKRHLWNGMARKNSERRDHPTQKPLDVMAWALAMAGEVSTVLDPWMGSGTTLRACKDVGKQCVGIEREEKWCELAAKRMEQECLSLGGGGAELVAKDSCDSPKSPNSVLPKQ